MLYQTVEETNDDIARLVLLEDFDGIKKRVQMIVKERL